jgi:hypothetical protein
MLSKVWTLAWKQFLHSRMLHAQSRHQASCIAELLTGDGYLLTDVNHLLLGF